MRRRKADTATLIAPVIVALVMSAQPAHGQIDPVDMAKNAAARS